MDNNEFRKQLSEHLQIMQDKFINACESILMDTLFKVFTKNLIRSSDSKTILKTIDEAVEEIINKVDTDKEQKELLDKVAAKLKEVIFKIYVQ